MNRDVTSVRGEGSKFVQDFAYNAVSGTFSWNCYLDLEYIEIFRLCFEDYSCTQDGQGHYLHTFRKLNNKKIPSFVFRVAQLDRLAAGPTDEVTEFRGCFVTSVKLSSSAGNSYVQVSISGNVTDSVMFKGNIPSTDYTEYDGQMAEFTCLFVGDDMNDDTYVSYVDSLSLSVDNGADKLLGICSPFNINFFEGAASFGLSVSAYSNDPERFRQRFFTGGQTISPFPLRPQTKGLQPCASLYIASYNLSVRDGDAGDIGTAIEESDKTFIIHVEDAVYKVAQWPSGDGSKLQEQISSAECRYVTIQIKTDIPSLETTNSHPVTAVTPS